MSGAIAALAVLTGIERRDRTGVGSDIDVAHMEAMWCALGEGIVVADRARHGHRADGQPRARCDESGFVAAADGRWVAYVGAAEVATRSAGQPWPDVVGAIRDAGGAAEVVNEVLDAVADERLADRFEIVDHPVTGPMRHVRSPIVIDGRATTTRRRAPLFDEHTDEILGEVADAGATCRAARHRRGRRHARRACRLRPVNASMGAEPDAGRPVSRPCAPVQAARKESSKMITLRVTSPRCIAS